ncbi:gra-orf6 [Symbiodinium natans]|uniref:Gra-orf6 protein n=1 Tax=Symbiodinium natans TaxID=878477 RepID=A0A812S9F1_9DINO|nr:gra-orf6 [Symbiodinium natans]
MWARFHRRACTTLLKLPRPPRGQGLLPLLGLGAGASAFVLKQPSRSPCAAEEQQKVALITGSSSGIGKAVAQRLAAEGYRVVVNSHSTVEEGTALAAALPGALYIRADCSKREGCEGLIEEVVKRCGRLDLLICNAGVGKVIPHEKLELIDDEYIYKIFALNCFGPLWLSRAAMPYLKREPDASIVMIGSVAGVRPMGSSIPYSMTRAAMHQLTKLLAKSCGPVRVNCVAPGLIETRITAGNEWGGSYDAVTRFTPLKRVGKPDDLADAVVCCARSQYMTGQIIVVDGGSSLVF